MNRQGWRWPGALAAVALAAACSGGSGGGGCELKAFGDQPSRIEVTNHLDHTIGWNIQGKLPTFSQQAPGECAQMGVAAGTFTVNVIDCANPDCNSPHLGEKDVTGTVAAGETYRIDVDASFFP